MSSPWFYLAATLNGLAALLHLWVIYKGGEGYRQFGAGERMARMADQGRLYPHIITLGIASALFFFAYLCISQIGLVSPPLFAREILWLLTGVYLLRGIYPLAAYRWVPLFQSKFFVVSSIIVLGFGLVHLLALKGL